MELTIPDGITPISGYRIWGVVRDGGAWLLQSTAAGFSGRMPVWAPGDRFSARCLSARRCADAAVPEPRHGCGIYAVEELDRAVRWARAIARHRPVVVGTVACWGRVVETEHGWRAQHAYPESFVTVVHRSRRRSLRGLPVALLEELAERYLAA